jgi:carbon storage regulator
MLVLTRKVGEELVIDGEIRVSVVRIQGNRVRIGIQAPADVIIRRQDPPGAVDPTGSKAPKTLCAPSGQRP